MSNKPIDLATARALADEAQQQCGAMNCWGHKTLPDTLRALCDENEPLRKENARLKEALTKANDVYEDGRWSDIYETVHTMHAIIDGALAPLDAKVTK